MTSQLHSIRERLAAGPARGLGAAEEIANEAAAHPETLQALIAALEDSRDVVLCRASNALKKLQQLHPQSLDPFAGRLIDKAFACAVLEARWNLMIVVGGLRLSTRERALAIELMFEAIESSSAFLRVFALQGLFDLSAHDEGLRARVRLLIARALDDTSAAVRARARSLHRLCRRASERAKPPRD